MSYNSATGVDANRTWNVSPSSRQLYGLSSGTSLVSAVYAANLAFGMVIPAANFTGSYYRGSIRISAFSGQSVLDSAGFVYYDSVDLTTLIRLADHVLVADHKQFDISACLSNDLFLTIGDHTAPSIMPYMASEQINYVIFQTPSINITTGASATYSLVGELSYHASVLATTADLLIYKAFEPTSGPGHSKLSDLSIAKLGPPPRSQKQLDTYIKEMESHPMMASSATTEIAGLSDSVIHYGSKAAMKKLAMLEIKELLATDVFAIEDLMDDLDESRDNIGLGKAHTVNIRTMKGISFIMKIDPNSPVAKVFAETPKQARKAKNKNLDNVEGIPKKKAKNKKSTPQEIKFLEQQWKELVEKATPELKAKWDANLTIARKDTPFYKWYGTISNSL